MKRDDRCPALGVGPTRRVGGANARTRPIPGKSIREGCQDAHLLDEQNLIVVVVLVDAVLREALVVARAEIRVADEQTAMNTSKLVIVSG